MYEGSDFSDEIDMEKYISSAIQDGKHKVAKWLASKCSIDDAMEDGLNRGHLDVVKWIIMKFATDLVLLPPDYMCLAAASGHLKMVKWLFKFCRRIGMPDLERDIKEAKRSARQNGHLNIVRFINVFHGLQTFKKAFRAWQVVSYWTKRVGEMQYAPTAPGGRREIAEFVSFNEQLPELVVVEVFGELGVFSNTKGKWPRADAIE
jgi:hypothetical protein